MKIEDVKKATWIVGEIEKLRTIIDYGKDDAPIEIACKYASIMLSYEEVKVFLDDILKKREAELEKM